MKDYRGLFCVVALLLLAPLLFVDYVPMVDLPGHLARIHILRNYDQVPQFREVYEIHGKPVPNLALDLIMVPLTYVLSLYHASRAFVGIGMLVFALGVGTLSYSVHGRITPLAVLALFAQYNSTFFYGFVAFQLGVGLSFLVVGLWYRWRSRWTAPRMAAMFALSVLIYLCHLGGFLYMSLGVGFLTLRTWYQERRIAPSSLLGLLPLVPPILIYLSLGKNQGTIQQIVFSTLPQKILHAGMLLVGFDRRVDAFVVLLLLAALGAALRYGTFRFHPEVGPLGVAYAVAFLVMPWVLLTGSDADARMVIGAGVYLLLSFTCDIPPEKGKVIFLVALAALLIRVAFCGWVWTKQSDFIAGHLRFLDAIPQGARIYPVMKMPENAQQNKFERVLFHVPDLATVRRQAIVPTTFAVRGQHSIVERNPRWYRVDIDPAHPESFDWNRVAAEYDVIWQYGDDPGLRAVLDSRFRLAGQHKDARLYRIR